MSEPNELIYEPRAYWEVVRVDTSDTTVLDPPTAAGTTKIRQLFDRENFRNGTRNPVELTHMLMCPVGYALAEYGDAYHASLAVLDVVELFVKLPDKRNLQIRPNRVTGWSATPNADMGMRQDPNLGYASGMLGITKWRFDRKLVIPQGGIVEFQLGSPLPQPENDAEDLGAATVAFFEPWGLVGGSARTKEIPQLLYTFPEQPHPFQPADGLGATPAEGQSFVYPPEQTFTRDEWRAQQGTNAGSTQVGGISIAIDQRALDDNIGIGFPGAVAAPISTRTPVGVARQFGAGSGAEWWRPGIPLALIGPTLGAARTYRLPRPIKLYPGDALDLELTVPVGVDFDEPAQPIYQIGVSFLGSAAVAG